MKVSRHEKAIREGLDRLEMELDAQDKVSEQIGQKISCLSEQVSLLKRLLETAGSMSSKSKEVSE